MAIESSPGAAIAVEVADLKKHYGATRAVDGISFTVGTGEVFGLLGPNGAGKTTTIECIEGLRPPDAGRISVLGLAQGPQARQIKGRIGVQLQTTGLYPKLTVRELVALFASFYPRHLPVAEAISLVGLHEKERTRSSALSGGQHQRLSLALALVSDPDVIFLDEPTTGLDPPARRGLWEIVRELQRQGKTVLLTTHYMEEAEQLCDRVAVIDHGRIIEIERPAALVQKYFRETAIEFVPGGDWRHDRLGALAGVAHVLEEDGHVVLYSADVPRTMAELFQMASQHGLTFQDVTVRQATLEDVFLKLTGRRIRE